MSEDLEAGLGDDALVDFKGLLGFFPFTMTRKPNSQFSIPQFSRMSPLPPLLPCGSLTLSLLCALVDLVVFPFFFSLLRRAVHREELEEDLLGNDSTSKGAASTVASSVESAVSAAKATKRQQTAADKEKSLARAQRFGLPIGTDPSVKTRPAAAGTAAPAAPAAAAAAASTPIKVRFIPFLSFSIR